MSGARLNLLLDSGAFSVWKLGLQIDLSEYIRFCLDNAEHIEKAVALDVIPGTPGMPRTPAMVAASAKAGWMNYRRMRKAGIDAMPVFHYRESWDWLHRMADDCEWIGLASAAAKWRRPWLDEAFARLSKYPHVRVHGFAETKPDIMRGYRWHSVDSASWTLCAKYGQVLFPVRSLEGRRRLLHLHFGTSDAKNLVMRRFAMQTPEDQAGLRAYIENMGFSVERLSAGKTTGQENRAVFNALVMERFLRGSTRLFFATIAGPRDALRTTGLRDRLVSFAYVQNSRIDLAEYVRTGGRRPRVRLGMGKR
jgi:hypothetical protein